MDRYHPEAEELNSTIKSLRPSIYELLSKRGKEIFFPKSGIIKQGAEAKNKDLNATVGMATDDKGIFLNLSSINRLIDLDPEEIFPYAPSAGIPELRKEWQRLILSKNPSLDQKISLPIVTCGITHGLNTAGHLFIDPGDKIIVSNLHWENYDLIFKYSCGASFIPFNTFKNKRLDTESLKKALEKREGKQILLLNFPHNPTGYTCSEEEAEEITSIIRDSAERGNKILTITDDAYFGLVYESGIYRESIFSRLSGVHENVLAVKIDGATKEEYAWGFRVGFITFGTKGGDKRVYEALQDKSAGVVRGTISSASRLSQTLLLRAIQSQSYEKEKREKFNLLRARYKTVCNVLKKNNGRYSRLFSPLPFNSGYFMCIQLKNNLDGEKIRQQLLNDYNTGVIASGKILRIAFSSIPTDRIEMLFENIYDVCRDKTH